MVTRYGEKFALNNVGYMHYRLGQHQEALMHYGQALSFEDVGDGQLHALLLDNTGLAYEKLGDYAKALDYQHKSLAIREATGDRWGVGDSLDGLGSVYMALGKTAEARQQLERQANEDSLTGLHNRRYFDARLTQAFDQARRLGKSLSVVLCDLDDFKEINDCFSHSLGDRVLVTVAALFRGHLRSADTVARYGGEEFVFLLPETTAVEAAIVSEKLRHAVAVLPWHTLAAELSVTASLGISDDLTVDSHHLLRSADLKLYEAKHRGKNQVRC